MANDGTNIRVSDEMWERLNRRKRPGESFNDVLERLLNRLDEIEE